MTPQVFISYSHQDEAWKDRIQAHLGVLARQGLLSVWDDRQIQAGQDWLPAIEQSMASCRVALLLISVDFLNSRFIESQEVPSLLKRRQAEGVRVIPVILKPCAWPRVEWLKGIQARPSDGKALSGMSEYDADLAMVSLVDEIAGLLAASSPSTPAAPAGKTANGGLQGRAPEWTVQKAQDTDVPTERLASVPPVAEPPPPSASGPRPFPVGLRRLAYALPAAAVAAALWNPASAWLKTVLLPPVVALPKACPECPEMVELPPGEFMMGSPDSEKERSDDEGPQHPVKIGYRLAMGKYEVSFAEWDACEAAKICPHAKDSGWGRGDRPVINVSWDDAQKYVAWLNGKADARKYVVWLNGKAVGQNYRLPSEAEWEYAARAGTSTPFSTGPCITTAQANYDGTRDYNDCGAKTGQYLQKTQPVGSYPANPWGLFDMHGNVWEWAQDCYHDSYQGAPGDGSAWDGGTNCADSRRVLRGGSWFNSPQSLRSAFRLRGSTGDRGGNIGFRLARTLTP